MASNAKTRRLDHVDAVDRLSCLPRNLIDLILEQLPLHDAAGTSILSRKWRNIWVMQPHLVFDEAFFSQLVFKNGSKRVSIKQKEARLSEVSKIISSILLVHSGPILKFHLSIPRDLPLHRCLDMIFWIVSNNGVRKLELLNKQLDIFKMPSHFFSCLELTHLSLTYCKLNPPPGFGGLCNLISVILVDVKITADMSLGTRVDNLYLERCTGIEHLGCQFKYNNNLTKLTIIHSREIDWGWFEYTQKVETLVLKRVINSQKRSVNLDKLFGNMRGLISLVIDAYILEFLEPGVPILKRLVTTMENLKLLRISSFGIYDWEQIQYFLCLTRSLPNLRDLLHKNGELSRKLDVHLYKYYCIKLFNLSLSFVICVTRDSFQTEFGVPPSADIFWDDLGGEFVGLKHDDLILSLEEEEEHLEQPDFEDMFLGQLETVKIWKLDGSRVELQLIKLLLAASPSLKWMKLEFYSYDPKAELRISRELMRFPRTSSAAQIIWT